MADHSTPVRVADDEGKAWMLRLTAFTPEQWLKLDAKARQVMEGSGYGRMVVEFTNGNPVLIRIEETERM